MYDILSSISVVFDQILKKYYDNTSDSLRYFLADFCCFIRIFNRDSANLNIILESQFLADFLFKPVEMVIQKS